MGKIENRYTQLSGADKLFFFALVKSRAAPI